MPVQRVKPVPQVTATGSQATNQITNPHAFSRDAQCIPCKVLKAGARGVLASWTRRPRATKPAEVRDLLAKLTSYIHQVWLDGKTKTPPVANIDVRMHSSLGRRLLEALRQQILEKWSERELPDSELLPLLLAVERVRLAIEPSWQQTFAQQLSGADGLALLTDVAHDLRSPLTSILVLTETLQRGYSGPVNEVQTRQLSLIYTAALGLSSVARDIIEFTQGSDQLVDQEPAAFSVMAMLQAVHDIVRPIAEEKRLTVRLLGPTHDERMGHPVALSRILLNLMTNALKFTDEGYVEIVAQEVAGGSRVEFAVRDSGRGIPAEKIPTLFQPLRKDVRRRRHLFSQTGLGLTICRKLASSLQSELKVESRTGWGTRFFFELDLPICAARRSGPRAAPVRPSAVFPVRNSGTHAARNSSPNGKRISGPTRA